MAKRVVTWDDFSGGFFMGPSANKQPANTWRGIDVTTSVADGYLVARPDTRTQVAQFTISGATAASGWSSFTYGGGWGSAPIVFESLPSVGSSFASTCFAWAELGGTPAAAVSRLVARGTSTYQGAATAGTAPLSNPIVCLDGQIATVYCSFAIPGAVGFAGTPVTGGEVVAVSMSSGTSSVSSTPEPLRIIEQWSEWLVGASVNSNRLYFGTRSAGLSDWTTSGTTGFFEVGDGSPIIAIVPTRDQIYIGKRNGWYALSGVLDDANSATLRQVAETMGPPGSYMMHDQAHRDAAILTDLGIIYPFDISFDDAARTLVPGPGGANGFASFSSSRARTIGYWPTEMGLDMGNMRPTGAVDLIDNAVMFRCAGTPTYDLAALPYTPGDIVNTSFMLKGDRWECWSGRGINDATYPTMVACRDMRRLDVDPAGRQKIYWFHSTTSGTTRTITVFTTNLHADLPQSYTPVRVKLASYAGTSPFTVESVSVVYDWGPIDVATGSSSVGVASVAAEVHVIGPPGSTNPEPFSASMRREVAVVDTMLGLDVYSDRKGAVETFRTNNLPECVEAEVWLELSGVRVRRVHMEISETSWGT